MPVLRNKEVAVGTDEEAQASLGRTNRNQKL